MIYVMSVDIRYLIAMQIFNKLQIDWQFKFGNSFTEASMNLIWLNDKAKALNWINRIRWVQQKVSFKMIVNWLKPIKSNSVRYFIKSATPKTASH